MITRVIEQVPGWIYIEIVNKHGLYIQKGETYFVPSTATGDLLAITRAVLKASSKTCSLVSVNLLIRPVWYASLASIL